MLSIYPWRLWKSVCVCMYLYKVKSVTIRGIFMNVRFFLSSTLWTDFDKKKKDYEY